MNSPSFFGEDLTAEAVGNRIQTAITEAPEPYRNNKVLIAGTLKISPDTLDNYIDGKTAIGAITMFRLAGLTEKPIMWFATGGEAVEMPLEAQLDHDLRRVLLSHKERRVKEIAELDALLGRL